MTRKAPTTSGRILRGYQVDAYDLLLSEALNTDTLGLFGPTGCGKTLILQTLLAQMVRIPEFRSALIVTPQTQIRDGFCTTGATVVLPSASLGIKAIQAPRVVEIPQIHDLTRKDREDRFKRLLHRGGGLIGTVCFQTLIRRAGMSPGTTSLFPKNLKGRILVVDEAHWLNLVESSKLDKVVALWRERGGLVIHSTATPFDLKLSPDTQFYCRTLAEHITDGVYAPGTVEIDFHQVKSLTARKLSQLRGEVMSEADLDALCWEIFTIWRKKGKPKTVMNLPVGGSEKFALVLEAVLRAQGVRVLNAVSKSAKVKSALLTALKEERALLNQDDPRYNPRYEASQYDVILSCKRFDEGTDWPFCALFINVGLPSDFTRILQRLGRTLRPKGEIQGYPARWRDKAEMLFVIPSAGHKVWEEFHQHGRDYVFMAAGLMADLRTCAYLAELDKRMGDGQRPRRGLGPKYWERLKRLASLLNLTLDQTREAYARCQEAVLVLRNQRKVKKLSGKDVTWGDIEPVLKQLGSFSQEELDRCQLALHVRHTQLKGDKELKAFLESLDAATTRKLGVRISGNRIVRGDLQEAFDTETCNFQGLIDDAMAAERVVGRITGETSKQVGERLVTRLHMPPLTKDQALKALKSYCLSKGKSPSPDEDASPWFGFPAGSFPWSSVPDELFR